MNAPHSTVHVISLRLPPADIAHVKFLIESYEEVGIVRTIDRQAAFIVLLVVPDFVAVARAILEDLRAHVTFEEIEPPPGQWDDWLMREINED